MKLLSSLLLCAGMVVANLGFAQAADEPEQKIADATAKLLVTIADHQATFDQDPGSYFAALDQQLAELVDFDFIAVNVMGNYRKAATPEQRDKFTQVFRASLIETYGRGLISYNNQTIELIPSGEPVSDSRKVTVRQVIKGGDGDVPLEYTVARKKDSTDWKVINVVINGINLGKTFRNQFMQSAQKNGGDIDAVIAGWTAEGV